MSTYKTRLGRNIAVLMAAALVFTGLPGTEAQAAKKAKLSAKKLTVTVGKKKTIKIKNKAKKAKYKFKSKKASIAKVSSKGVVTGKKKGSTKITVTEKKGKKTRKLGTVTVTVKPVKKPAVTKAPTPPAVVPSANPNQPSKAPDVPAASQPSTQQPTKAPTLPPTDKPSKPPTPPPTEKPTPTPDPYTPSPEGGWVKLDLSSWSGGEGNYLETGNQFILDDTELETVPLPETPAIDQIGQKVEILIRGSLAEQSSGFRFWLANATGATISQQYIFTESSVGIGTDAGNADLYQLGKPFHLQATLEHTNHDGSEDTLATTLLLKGPSYGTYLEGVTITGIWIRYGDKIGSTTEDPGVSNPGVESPGMDLPEVETPSVNITKSDLWLQYYDKEVNADGSVTLTKNQGAEAWQGGEFGFVIPKQLRGKVKKIIIKYKDATLTDADANKCGYTFHTGDEEKISWVSGETPHDDALVFNGSGETVIEVDQNISTLRVYNGITGNKITIESITFE